MKDLKYLIYELIFLCIGNCYREKQNVSWLKKNYGNKMKWLTGILRDHY